MKASEVLCAYFECEEHRDVEAIMEFYAPNAVFETPERTYYGREEIRSFYTQAIAEFPGLRVVIRRCLDDESAATVEWRAVLSPPAGKPTLMRGVNVADVSDGLIVSARAYFAPEPELLLTEQISG